LQILRYKNGRFEKEMEGFKFDGEDIIIHLNSSILLDIL